MTRLKLAVLASHVIQYQDPFFRLLAAEPELDVEVLYCSDAGARNYLDADMGTTLQWDLDMLHGYRYRFLRNLAPGDLNGGFWRLVNPGLVPAIWRGRYDAVLMTTGWGSFSALLGMAACRASGTPFLLFGDSAFPPAEHSLRQRIRALGLRAVVQLASRFMISGAINGEYYRHYGADPRRFFPLPWSVDNSRFEQGSRFAPGERETLRARYGIAPDQMAILFSAKLIERKNPMTLLQAYERMRLRDRAALIFMGEGTLRESLESYAREHNLGNVHFLGFINQSDIPQHYAMCDLFVLPSSYEPRGSVLNEAMASGLPLLVTDRCGAVGDIVQHGQNAFVFDPDDMETLTKQLDTVAGDPTLRASMAARSREIISNWTFAEGVAGVRAALHDLYPAGASRS